MDMTIEEARRIYLLVLCDRRPNTGSDSLFVSREYLREKVEYIFRCKEVWEIRNSLDIPGQQAFDQYSFEWHMTHGNND